MILLTEGSKIQMNKRNRKGVRHKEQKQVVIRRERQGGRKEIVEGDSEA